MKKWNALIVGAGNQGALSDAPGSGQENKIISFAHAFKEHQGFNLLGFHDIDKEKAANAAIAWETDYWSGYPIDADVIVIATPDKNHFEPLQKALSREPKLVIVEKPICDNLNQAREIVELYKAKGIPLMVNYTRRFLPYYEELKRKYKAGEFGRLVNYDALFNRDLLHTGSHLVDFLTWFSDFELPDGLFIKEVNVDYRVWQIQLLFEKHFWQEQRIGNQPVWPYYDKSHWHVVENAYNFLKGREPLKCTASEAMKSLEICFKLMEGQNARA